jgi:16S rRNA (guanine966-N2)-methyltransferase
VREALFNILDAEHYEGKPFLDLAAGTGAVGIEAFSRGASPVFLVERDRQALAVIHKNLGLLGAEGLPELCAVAADVGKWLKRARLERPAGVVFLDPPYGERALARWLELLASSDLIDRETLLIVEHRSGDPPKLGVLQPLWERRYGDASLTAAML